MLVPEVELDECILCGICIDVCPDVFSMNESGYIEVKELDEYPADDVQKTRKLDSRRHPVCSAQDAKFQHQPGPNETRNPRGNTDRKLPTVTVSDGCSGGRAMSPSGAN